MKHLSKILLLCWVLLISSLKTIAQNYPVQCTPIVTPPYSLSWTDYATSTEKFKVYLLLKDLEKPSVEVTIRIRLKGLWVVLENIPDFVSTKPIVLQPGIPQILSGAQLSDNFSADNLVAQGITIEELYQGTNLPAGFYQWEVTAYLPDQRQVSNTGVTLMTVFRAQPPTITYPANNAILPNTGFQSINFTWVSNSYYSVNTAQGTLYRLRLYEIPEEDEDTDPNVVVNAGILPVFMTEVLATNYLYSSSDPVLTPGKRYALQVQAMDVNGYDQFENNGFSQVVAFTYGTQGQLATQRCLRPQEVSIEPVGDAGVVVSWTNPNAEVLDYTLSYRKTTDDQWIEKQTSESSYTLLQLPASSYEFKVLARCSYVSKSSFSQPQGYIIEQEPIDSTMQINPPSNTIDEDTDYTSETYTVSDSNPSQQYPPAVYQAETLSSTTIDILNKPIRIVYETSSLPDSLKKSLPSSGTLPQLSSTATVEELTTALNTSKIDCASYLAGYTCGQHDAPSVPSGDIIQVKTGDEIAINSIAFEVVDLDGSGNGKGIVKVPMFNNAKLGVDFKNIKVAKGGCVVAGQAELSHIDVALLSEEQRRTLAEIYAAYNLALTVADSLAPEISETINSLSDLYKKIAEKTQAILDKVNSGMKISSAEQKKLEVMKKSAKDIVEKQVMYFTERFGKNGSEEIINLINTSSQSCICQQYIAPSTPSKGPNAELEEWFFYSEDCTKCLQEDIKKQQEMVTLSKAMEDKLNAIKGQKMECGCGWNSIKLIWQSVGDNGDCEEIVKVMNKFKEDLQTSGTATVKIQYMPFDTNKPLGQISIGDICIDNFSLELLPHDASGVQVYSSKKDQYDDSAVKISGNSLIFNDYQSPTTKTLTLKTDNNDQTILVEKWLFEKAKVMDEGTNSNDILDDETFKKYAKLAGIKDFIAFKAFTVVESGGNGFFEVDGKKVPKLLFERHLMYKCLRDGKIWGVVASNDPRKDNNIVLSELLENRPEIVAKTGFEWCKKCASSNNYVIKGENCETNSHNEIWFYNHCYIPTKENYEKRFLEAAKIHKECAYMATSWGLGQVIGANFRSEFTSIDEMEKELMNGNSSSQLFIMASFIKNNSTLKNAINNKEWAIAASEYNGPNYSKNKYDEKLKKEYEKLKK